MKKGYVPALNYNFLTPFYDFFVELLGYGKAQRSKVVDMLNLKSAENLIDVGCGTGTLLTVAKDKYPSIDMIGIDIDPGVLSIARKKAQEVNLEIKYIETSSAKLPFADKHFNVAVSSLVFHHLPTEIKKHTIKEVYRVLKKDGRFLLADFGKKEGLLLHFFNFITKLLNLPESKTLQDNLKGNIPNFLKEAGFKVTEVSKRYRGIQFLLAEK